MTKRKLRVIIRKKDRIDYIVNGVCDFYKFPQDQLVNKRARTKELYKVKRMAIKLLRDIADCSYKDIKYIFPYGDEANAWIIYNKITEDLEAAQSINTELKKEYSDLLKSMDL